MRDGASLPPRSVVLHVLEPRIVRRHPLAVVLDTNQLLAAEFHGHSDAPRAGVDGVLDQLLDDLCGPLHHLTRGDLVRQVVGQPGDLGHQ